MEEKTVKLFFDLIRKAIGQGGACEVPPDADYGALLRLSAFHDLAHLVYFAQKDDPAFIASNSFDEFKKHYDISLLRQAKKEIAAEEIASALNAAGVPFIFLKGTVLMSFYPEPWMRTSSDVDILVRSEDHPRAADALVAAGMTRLSASMHDISLTSRSGFHVELHDTLIEQRRLPRAAAVLDGIWDHAAPVGETDSEYALDGAMFYFYHIAHMVKHFESGGCGVRSFLDLTMLASREGYGIANAEKFLREGGLLKFAESAEKLAAEWFSGAEADPALRGLSEYVIEGGLYGTQEHGTLIRRRKSSGRIAYYAKRAFPSYKRMTVGYPLLKKYPVLLPVCWVARWFKLTDPEKKEKYRREIEIEKKANTPSAVKIEALMKDLEIWK